MRAGRPARRSRVRARRGRRRRDGVARRPSPRARGPAVDRRRHQGRDGPGGRRGLRPPEHGAERGRDHRDERQDDDRPSVGVDPARGGSPDRHDRHPLRDPHHAGGPRAAGSAGRVPRRRLRGRRDGGLVACARPAPGRRHPLRRRRLHQPRERPSRSARQRPGVLPGQVPPVHPGTGGHRDHQHRRCPRAAAARRGADPDRAVLGHRRHRRRGLGEQPRLHVARSSASPSASAARST